MGFIKTFPYNTGTFVVINEDGVDMSKSKALLGRLDSIVCYLW